MYSRQPHHQEYQLLPTPDPSHQKEKRYWYLLTTAKRSEVSSQKKSKFCICPTSLLVTFLQVSKPPLKIFMDTRIRKTWSDQLLLICGYKLHSFHILASKQGNPKDDTTAYIHLEKKLHEYESYHLYRHYQVSPSGLLTTTNHLLFSRPKTAQDNSCAAQDHSADAEISSKLSLCGPENKQRKSHLAHTVTALPPLYLSVPTRIASFRPAPLLSINSGNYCCNI